MQSKPISAGRDLSHVQLSLVQSQHRVTIREIAEATGYSTFTVSAALRDIPKVKAATRAAIQKAAKELGYRPNPILSALGASRFRKQQDYLPIVAMAMVPREPFWMRHFETKTEQVKALANTLGATVEVQAIHDEEMFARCSRQWFERGVEGILIRQWVGSLQLPSLSVRHDAFSWMSTCMIDRGLDAPIHCVSPDHKQNIITAWSKAVEAGYRRIGAVFFEHDAGGELHDDVDRRTGATLAQLDYPTLPKIPPLWIPVGELSPKQAGDVAIKWMKPWLDRYRPEVVIGLNAFVYHLVKRAGLLMPEHIAFLDLQHNFQNTRIQRTTVACLLDVEDVCLEVALKHLLRMIANRERGLPIYPEKTLIQAPWHAGNSMPDRRS